MGTAGAEADLSRLKVQQQDLGMGTLYTGDYGEPVKNKPHRVKAFWIGSSQFIYFFQAAEFIFDKTNYEIKTNIYICFLFNTFEWT